MMDFGLFKANQPVVTKQMNSYTYHASISRPNLDQQVYTIRFMQDDHDDLGMADVVLLQQEMSQVMRRHRGACKFSWYENTLLVRGGGASDFLLCLMQSDCLDRLACDEIKRLMPDQAVPDYRILHL